ncbi:EthD family reductase [Panacibacter sp. DH6]|uniref:EthD family reductase n=1 Tax=Panacibacter microcysteis TaxID=2793269 RepID=A0A931MC99_9BACT|nr:EthD family reductase [Panacibacter microcysteis]MBG9377975.1 EthD family reductase [Panacibacter microcysteis]
MRRSKIIVLCTILMALLSCKSGQLNQSATPEKGMVKVAILYAGGEGKTFDMDYYENKHMPMMAGLLGKNLKFYEIDKGIAGRTPNDPVPFVAIGYFYCYDMAEYNKTIAQNREAIVSDIKKYTNIQPTIQISEVRQVKYNTTK